MNSLLRLDRFTLLFLALSTVGSFTGQWVFQAFGVYEDRTISTLYLITFGLLLGALALVFRWSNRSVLDIQPPEVEHNRLERYVALTVATLAVSLPFQLLYLVMLYR